MSETLRKRLKFYGGNQEARMQHDKLTSLKRALLYSYQAQTAVVTTQLQDGTIQEQQFRCLINDDKLKGDYDNKIISIPYQDICLFRKEIFQTDEQITDSFLTVGNHITSMGLTPTKIKTGTVFLWKQTNTHWLVYLQYLEQDSYFRADIRRCDQQVEVNGKKYWTYIRGPVETSIQWNQKAQVEWNDLNHSLVMYITKDQNTVDYFHRFTKIKIEDPNSNNKPRTWQVVNANAYFGDDIIEVYLDEYYDNQMQDARLEQLKQKENNNIQQHPPYPHIDGPAAPTCYDEVTYTIHNFNGQGIWTLQKNNSNEKITIGKQKSVTFTIDTGRSAVWQLAYSNQHNYIPFTINIQSF